MYRPMKRPLMGRRGVLGVAGALMLPAPSIRAQGKGAGVALVIGNSKYQRESALPNPKRDTTDVAARFKAYGLQTELVQDADRATMDRAITGFGARAKGANFAAFYYAGHGVFFGNGTWMVPVEGDLGDPDNVKTFVNVSMVREAIKDAQNKLMVFDNCLNNPADGWKQRATEDRARSGAGVRVQEPPNTIALFSTIVGRIALDGPPGENSPFAASFLRQFDGSPVDLRSVPVKLRRDLLIATEARQIASYRSTYREPFTLTATESSRAAIPANRSTWASDPSRIIDLAKAYAFAEEHKLPLQPGLIAHRPAAGVRHANKAGSYRFEAENDPAILVVMSVEQEKAAEVVMVYKHNGIPQWSFVRGNLSNDRLEMSPREYGGQFVFTWSDANSGSVANFPQKDNMKSKITTGRFTRLDG
jgi:hypothetical protein